MPPNDESGFERELRLAMARQVAGLGLPRTDLGAIRRRTAYRRRVLVPLAVGLISMLVAGPLALAQGVVRLPGRGGPEIPEVPKVVETVPGGQVVPDAGRPVSPILEREAGTGRPGPGSTVGGQGGQGGQGGGVAGGTLDCVTASGPLPKAVRDTLVADATGVVSDAERSLDATLGKVQRLTVAGDTADKLVPKVGSMVQLVTCGDKVSLAPGERDAILGTVRAVVVGAATVTGGVVNETVVGLGLGVVTPVTVAVVSASPQAVVLDATLGGGPVPRLGSVTMTMRPDDAKVTKVDLQGLELEELNAGGLGSLPLVNIVRGFDLAEGLRSLGRAAGADGGSSLENVLAEDVTIVPLPS